MIDIQGRHPPGIGSTCGIMADLLHCSVQIRRYDNQTAMLSDIYMLLLPWSDWPSVTQWIEEGEFIDPTLISYRNQPARKEDVLRKRMASPMAMVDKDYLGDLDGQL